MTRRTLAILTTIVGAGLVALGGYLLRDHWRSIPTARIPAATPHHTAGHSEAPEPADNTPEPILFPRDAWKSAGIRVEPVVQSPLAETVELTGKITLNEDRLAHIYPLVEGRVESVNVRLGDRVRKGQSLIVIQSREVGQLMLELFQSRLKLEFAMARDRWTQDVARNTLRLVEQMRADASIMQIEQDLKDKILGDSREKLMSAYVAHRMAMTNLQRLQPLTTSGAIPARQITEAESTRDASRATLQAILEQTSQDAALSARRSTQDVRELQTSIAVAETNLKILGFSAENLAEIDPSEMGEALSHVPILAPFDGTVITKDAVLLERAAPDQQILTIADLSSVWVSADIYESHLPLLAQLGDKTLRIRSDSWPDRYFEASIFYSGDVVQEGSRTVALRAAADNSDGLLKPGMFVTVELPELQTNDVLHAPLDALQDHESHTFVFVQTGEETFERRDVATGRRNRTEVEIVSGLTAGERIVVAGGFALKSRMLAELLAE